jgi:hypothetical protein
MARSRKGIIKVMNGRKGSHVQEELGDTIRMYTAAEWADELAKRQAMTEDEFDAYVADMAGTSRKEAKKAAAAAPAVGGKKGAAKKTATKKVAKKVAAKKKVAKA